VFAREKLDPYECLESSKINILVINNNGFSLRNSSSRSQVSNQSENINSKKFNMMTYKEIYRIIIFLKYLLDKFKYKILAL
jgi:hypothetical protein